MDGDGWGMEGNGGERRGTAVDGWGGGAMEGGRGNGDGWVP